MGAGEEVTIDDNAPPTVRLKRLRELAASTRLTEREHFDLLWAIAQTERLLKNEDDAWHEAID